MDRGEGAEERLTGGNASASVVRIGKTVRKPWLATTERSLAYMRALRTAAAMHELLRRSHESGREPWGSMYAEGHGQHWLATAEFINEHERDWRRAVTSTPTH